MPNSPDSAMPRSSREGDDNLTIGDFANRVGVSTATVSRAFTGHGRISPRTRTMILQRAAELGYHPNIHASSMGRRRSDVLAFFYDAGDQMDTDYYVAELTYGISCAASQASQGLQIHAVRGNASPDRLAAQVCNGSLDGFMVNLYTPWAAAMTAIADRRRIPYLVIDNTRDADSHTLSMRDAIRAAAVGVGAYFRRIGRRHPAFIHGIHDASKLDGYSQGLGDLGAALVEDSGGSTFAAGYEAYQNIHASRLRGGPAVDCLFAANDVLAMGAIRAAHDLGQRVPEDLAVIGCDDLQMARYHTPALTTLHLPKFKMGEHAVRHLLCQIAGTPVPEQPPYECPLIIRGSA